MATGDLPTFYWVLVTVHLSNSVATGQNPGVDTQFIQYTPDIQGMNNIQDRLTAMQDFLAFRQFVDIFWHQLILEFQANPPVPQPLQGGRGRGRGRGRGGRGRGRGRGGGGGGG